MSQQQVPLCYQCGHAASRLLWSQQGQPFPFCDPCANGIMAMQQQMLYQQQLQHQQLQQMQATSASVGAPAAQTQTNVNAAAAPVPQAQPVYQYPAAAHATSAVAHAALTAPIAADNGSDASASRADVKAMADEPNWAELLRELMEPDSPARWVARAGGGGGRVRIEKPSKLLRSRERISDASLFVNHRIIGDRENRNAFVAERFRRWAAERDHLYCATPRCKVDDKWLGTAITLNVDHIDGDCLNDELSNLRLLCPNCHSQTPTFAGRNKGKTF